MDPLSAFLHSTPWETHLNASGFQTARLANHLFVKRNIPGGHYWHGARSGPLPNPLPDFTKGSWFLRVEPENDAAAVSLSPFTTRPTSAIQPRQTLTLDLKKSPETLLAEMKSKHRYNINVAKREGVEVELHSTDLLNQFPRFWVLLRETADRHTFRTHTESYYRSILEHLEPFGMVHLAFARYQDQDIATFMIITCGTVATYLHGGSLYSQRQVMAPYALHWHCIETLQKQGFTTYDFWGTHAVDGEPIAGHASAGTTRFKLGFGGTLHDYPAPQDVILNPFCYSVFASVQRLRSRKRAFS